jgi:hypothetical protein
VEKDREIAKLVRVLGRISGTGRFAVWRELPPDAASFCVRQFNRVLARITELEPAASALFAPLREDASPTVTRMAAHDLAEYFGEVEVSTHERRRFRNCGPKHAFVGAVHFGGKC